MKRDVMRKIWSYINLVRTLPAIITLYSSGEKKIIQKDITRWIECLKIGHLNLSMLLYFNWLMVYYPEFRNVFYYRIKKSNFIVSKLLQIFYFPLSTLYINTSCIGPGLYIQHGFSTIISAKTIGENCSIFQQVTIGYNGDYNPIIEDNVVITAGAVVVGGINIGSNSVIGANCLVSKSVPSNCTVAGNPAYIIKKSGIKTKRYL